MKGQMDVLTYLVSTTYYNCKFLGKAPTKDVHTKFEICLSSLDSNKMIQVYFSISNSVDPSNLSSFF